MNVSGSTGPSEQRADGRTAMTTIEASVRDVATRQMLLRKGTTCEVVDHLFRADARRSSVLVALDDGCLLVNRQSFSRR